MNGTSDQGGHMVTCPLCRGTGAVPPEVAASVAQPPKPPQAQAADPRVLAAAIRGGGGGGGMGMGHGGH